MLCMCIIVCDNMKVEYNGTIRKTKTGSGRIHVPPELAKFFANGQLVQITLDGELPGVVII